MNFELSEHIAKDLPDCPCCDRQTRAVGGVVLRDGDDGVIYTLRWIPGFVREHGASLTLGFPDWDYAEVDDEHLAIELEFRVDVKPSGFFILDGSLRRDEVLTSEYFELAESIIDFVWARDSEIDELRYHLPKVQVLRDDPPVEEIAARPTLDDEKPAHPTPESPTATDMFYSTDDDVESCTRRAQANWQRFVTAFEHGDGDLFQVKRPFHDGERSEMLWVAIDSMQSDNRVLSGVVNTNPEVVGNVHAGKRVKLSAEVVIDWVVIKHGGTYAGGYGRLQECPDDTEQRHNADRLDLPLYLLNEFDGVDLAGPMPDLSAVPEAEKNPLRHPAILVAMTRSDDPMETEPRVVRITADDGETIGAEEMIRKLHRAAGDRFHGSAMPVFDELLCMGVGSDGVPLYMMLTQPYGE